MRRLPFLAWFALALFALGCGDDAFVEDVGSDASDGATAPDAVEPDAATDAATDGVTRPDTNPPGVDAGNPDSSMPPGCGFGGRPGVGDSPLPHASGRTESARTGAFTDEYILDATGTSKLGVRREWGSSVVFFGETGSGTGSNNTNTIDANDTGREVQVALYDPDRSGQGCSWNATCATAPICPVSIRYLGWNPVQGGNRCNVGSPTDAIRTPSGSLVAVTTPLQWNPDWDAPECSADSCRRGAAPAGDIRLTQTVRFVAPRTAEVQYTVENLSDIARRPALQEMPTIYTANGRGGPDLWRLMDPNGTQIAIDTPAGGDGFFFKDFSSSAPWVSLQNDDLSYGVAILYENGLQDFQGWQKRDVPFNNVRSRIIFGVPARGTVSARAYLIYGSFTQIQAEAARVMASIPAFGSLDSPLAEVGPGVHAIGGWALDNRGIVSVEARIDESVTVPLTYGAARPDVCLAWPGYPACPNVGYSGEYDFGPATECPHLVEIIVTDTDGNRRTIAERLVTVR